MQTSRREAVSSLARRRVRRGSLEPLGAVLLGSGFVILTLLVVTRWHVMGLDRRVDNRIPPFDGGPAFLHLLAEIVSTAASPPTTLALAVGAVVLAAAWSRHVRPVTAAAPAFVALAITVLASKWIIGRHGPPGSSIEDGLGYYPSGHTATAIVCAGTLAVLLARRYPRHRRALTVVAAGWGALVAWSMVWLHYHWVTDVLGGALLATWLLWLLYRWPAQLAGPVGRHDRAGRPVPRGPSLPEGAGGR